jgi:succinate dehydrogenase hydrophobic anchor subunit
VTGFVLVLLLGAEGVTVLRVGNLIVPHIVVGTILLAPVALKLGSTGWKIVHYYANTPEYVRAGPPPLGRRLLAPIVIVTSIGLLGSGAALMLMGPSDTGRMPFLHKAFFVVWFLAMALHVLLHAAHSLRSVSAEVTAPAGEALPGRPGRAVAIAATLAAGVGLAVWSAPYVSAWSTAVHH